MNYLKGYHIFMELSIKLIWCRELHFLIDQHTECNPEETKEIQRQIGELLEKGYMRESLSPCFVPTLLVSKKDGTMRMCMGSRAINKITVKYRFSIPILDDLLDEFDKSIGHVDLLLLLHGESLRGITLCFVCFIV